MRGREIKNRESNMTKEAERQRNTEKERHIKKGN